MKTGAPIDSNRHTLADFFEGGNGDLFDKTAPMFRFIEDMKRKGTYTFRRPLVSSCARRVLVREGDGSEREMLMMASNNYLGLNTRPNVIRAAQAALRKYGTGQCGAPLLNGTYDLALELERELAAFVRCEEAVVFSTGYSANVGAISALARRKDLVLIDRLDHASIVDGCKLAGCACLPFRHGDAEHLRWVLRKHGSEYEGRLVAVDGVFSMDGDIAPLPELLAACREYGARLMVDEAHALGVLGRTGAGTVEHFGLQGQVDIIMGTFSKSLGSTGGFIASSREVANYLRHYARSYFFSASPPPAVIGGVLAALRIIRAEPELRERLWKNVRRLHARLCESGLDPQPNPPQSAVLTVLVGPSARLRAVNRRIHRMGLYINSVEFPAVAMDSGLLRIGLMATHTEEDLDYAAQTIAEAIEAEEAEAPVAEEVMALETDPVAVGK